MRAGLHLPQFDVDGAGLSRERVLGAVDAARDAGFTAVCANDHFAFGRPWLDGPTLLALAAGRAGRMDLMTTVALPTLRGAVPLASAAIALDALSDGRVVLGVAAGSSRADYDAVGVPFAERGRRLDGCIAELRTLLAGSPSSGSARGTDAGTPPSGPPVPAGWMLPDVVRASGVEVWVGSWGSAAGLSRVARCGDGWLASAYNCDPEAFGRAMAVLAASRPAGNGSEPFPHAVVTMWTWVTESRAEADRKLAEVARVVGRTPETLAGRLCIGPAEACAELLDRYARAGCRQVHVWPLGDEPRQVELLAGEVLPRVRPDQ